MSATDETRRIHDGLIWIRHVEHADLSGLVDYGDNEHAEPRRVPRASVHHVAQTLALRMLSGVVKMHVAELARACGLRAPTVRRAMRALEDIGFLRLQKRSGEHSRTVCLATVPVSDHDSAPHAAGPRRHGHLQEFVDGLTARLDSTGAARLRRHLGDARDRRRLKGAVEKQFACGRTPEELADYVAERWRPDLSEDLVRVAVRTLSGIEAKSPSRRPHAESADEEHTSG